MPRLGLPRPRRRLWNGQAFHRHQGNPGHGGRDDGARGEVLREKGCRVLRAGEGEEAIALAGAGEEDIDLLITDLVMPRMNGRDLAAELHKTNPRLKVLYISGYIGKASVRIAELGPGTSFLSKPFSPESLARKLRLLLDTEPVEPTIDYHAI